MTTEWREVCRWEEIGSLQKPTLELPESTITLSCREWREDGLPLSMGAVDWRAAFDYALAAFEELAEEHRELEEAFFHDAEVLSTPCPGDPEDYTFVRAYYRPRRSKAANSAPCEASPTGDKEPATNPPNTSSGEATGQGLRVLVGGEWCEASDALKGTVAEIQAALNGQPEERSE